MVEWAIDCLQAGHGDAKCAQLAGADSESDEEIRELFKASARGIGVSLPPDDSDTDWMETFLCEEIVNGRMSELDGLADLYQLWLNTGMGSKHMVWVYLADRIDVIKEGHRGIEPFQDLKEETIPSTIRMEARKLLDTRQRLIAPSARHQSPTRSR